MAILAKRFTKTLSCLVLLSNLFALPALAAGEDAVTPVEILSYTELMGLPEAKRIEYIEGLREILVEVSKSKGSAFAATGFSAEERSRLEAMLEFLNAQIPAASAEAEAADAPEAREKGYRGWFVVPEDKKAYSTKPTQWRRKSAREAQEQSGSGNVPPPGYVRGAFPNTFVRQNESQPAASTAPAPVVPATVTQPAPAAVLPPAPAPALPPAPVLKAVEKDEAAFEALIQKSAKPDPNFKIELPPEPAKSDSPRETQSDVHRESASARSSGVAGVDAAKKAETPKHMKSSCPVQLQQCQDPRPRPSTHTACVFAGNMSRMGSSANAGKCFLLPEIQIGNTAYKCEKNQAPCNPLLFGILRDGSGPICVGRGNNATELCARLSTSRGAESFLNSDRAGIVDDWNNFATAFKATCNPESADGRYNCPECNIIRVRLTNLAKRISGVCSAIPEDWVSGHVRPMTPGRGRRDSPTAR